MNKATINFIAYPTLYSFVKAFRSEWDGPGGAPCFTPMPAELEVPGGRFNLEQAEQEVKQVTFADFGYICRGDAESLEVLTKYPELDKITNWLCE